MDTQEQNKKEIIIPNCITFNGIIKSNPVEVGENINAIELEGKNGDEFPIILVESTLEAAKENLKIGSEISAFGFLKKVNDDWVIMCQQLSIQ